jgi:hypothetical protein
MFIKRVSYLVLFFLNFVNLQSEAQKAKPKYIFTNDTLYSDKSNVVGVIIPKEQRKFIKFEISQGRAYTDDKQLYLIDSLQNGYIIISLIQFVNSKKIILEKRKLTVLTSPEQLLFNRNNVGFELLLSGYKGGRIPDSVVKIATKVSVSQGYNFNEAVVYIGSSKEFSHPNIHHFKSEIFDEHILSLLKKVKSGDYIIFDEIKFRDNHGNQFVYPKSIQFIIE